jgi:hypothetical protein
MRTIEKTVNLAVNVMSKKNINASMLFFAILFEKLDLLKKIN